MGFDILTYILLTFLLRIDCWKMLSMQAVFNDTEEFVLSIDESLNEVSLCLFNTYKGNITEIN